MYIIYLVTHYETSRCSRFTGTGAMVTFFSSVGKKKKKKKSVSCLFPKAVPFTSKLTVISSNERDEAATAQGELGQGVPGASYAPQLLERAQVELLDAVLAEVQVRQILEEDFISSIRSWNSKRGRGGGGVTVRFFLGRKFTTRDCI